MEAIINSMTPKERRNQAYPGLPQTPHHPGSGTQVQDLNRLLKQHKQI